MTTHHDLEAYFSPSPKNQVANSTDAASSVCSVLTAHIVFFCVTLSLPLGISLKHRKTALI